MVHFQKMAWSLAATTAKAIREVEWLLRILTQVSLYQIKLHCVTHIDFLSLIKRVKQFLMTGKLFLERQRGRDLSLSLFFSLFLSVSYAILDLRPLACKLAGTVDQTGGYKIK